MPVEQKQPALGLRLIRIGGGLNLAFALGHLGFWRLFDWPVTLAGISANNQAILYVLNIHLAVQLLVLGGFSLFYTRGLTETRIGQAVLCYMAFFWLFRAAEEFIFFGTGIKNIVFFFILVAVAILFLVPFCRAVRKGRPLAVD